METAEQILNHRLRMKHQHLSDWEKKLVVQVMEEYANQFKSDGKGLQTNVSTAYRVFAAASEAAANTRESAHSLPLAHRVSDDQVTPRELISFEKHNEIKLEKDVQYLLQTSSGKYFIGSYAGELPTKSLGLKPAMWVDGETQPQEPWNFEFFKLPISK